MLLTLSPEDYKTLIAIDGHYIKKVQDCFAYVASRHLFVCDIPDRDFQMTFLELKLKDPYSPLVKIFYDLGIKQDQNFKRDVDEKYNILLRL